MMEEYKKQEKNFRARGLKDGKNMAKNARARNAPKASEKLLNRPGKQNLKLTV